MATQASVKGLLLVLCALLLANIVVLTVHGAASPAHAQPARTCVGVAVCARGSDVYVFRAWSDGSVECRARSSPAGTVW